MSAHRTGYRWWVFLVLAVGYAIVYLHRVAPAVVAPGLVRSFDISGASLGVLASAYFYPYALMQLPAGLLSDSFGPRKTVTLFTVVAGAGALVLGLSPTFGGAVAGRVLVGLGVSMVFVPTLKILANWFEVSEFAALTGVLMAVGGLGWLLAATPLAVLTALAGWRMAFVVLGFGSVGLAAATYLMVRDRPRSASDEGSEACGATAARVGKPGSHDLTLVENMRMVVSEKRFWPLGVWFFFTGAILFGFGGLWAGPYLRQVYHLGETESGNILMMIAVGMILGSPLLSHFSQRIFGARRPLLLASSGILVAVWLLFVFRVDRLSMPALYLLFLLLGVFASGIVVVGFTSVKELFPLQIAGTSTGMINLFPFAGGALFQPLVGILLDVAGERGMSMVQSYRLACLVFLAAAAGALTAAAWIKETYGVN